MNIAEIQDKTEQVIEINRQIALLQEQKKPLVAEIEATVRPLIEGGEVSLPNIVIAKTRSVKIPDDEYRGQVAREYPDDVKISATIIDMLDEDKIDVSEKKSIRIQGARK